ncbi:putative glycosyltransferase family 28 domain-containing protein [Rosellinia necatrix]|uniref:Putative glycosyltransferase family 28 domain-containing protein n=1 Tax=Rosellinia necatrix TaxID=77044 RepID=A0A1W2TLF6_ROSNE|nr:putative glycosyltransferase family 28 domain-containing protein [Rosellinia necatrix]
MSETDGMDEPRPPFTTPVLEECKEQQDFNHHLPAARRTKQDHIVVPQADADFLGDELLVKRINNIQDWLWVCGRPMPPRPLHYQLVLSREISITESPELHLVWSKNHIFLKPLPSWLLDPAFWTSHILHDHDLARCARGFLFSYTALIAYQSDFNIAQERGLLPSFLTWPTWKRVVREVLENHDMAMVNPRYWYGELRLGRLNTVYRLRGFVFRGYSKIGGHAVYADLIADNFAVLATVLGYVVIVLTSLQVGLGVDRLLESNAFVDFSYGFTIFSIIAPLVAAVGILFFVLAMFISNWVVTKKYEERRFKEMGVEPYWRDKADGAPGAPLMKRRTPSSDPRGSV